MANVGSIQTSKGQQFTSAHVLSQSRAGLGYYVLSGCDVNQSGTPGMSVVVDSGYAQAAFGTTRKTVAGGTLTVATADATYPRIDVVYIDASGTIGIYAGTPTAISPSSKTDYKEMATPAPGSSIPTGIILSLVYVAANASSIINANINDIATYGPYVVESPSTTTSGKIPYWSGTAKTLSDGYSVGTTANCIVQLDGSSKLPAVDGTQLTGIILSNVLTTQGDILVRNGSGPTRLANGTKSYRLVAGTTDPEYVKPEFVVDFVFGDGSAVIPDQQVGHKIPIASKIVYAELTSRDTAGDLLSGSVTSNIYIHDYNANADSVSSSDSFALSSASSLQETGLSIAVSAGKYITCVISSITSCKQVTLTLGLEGT